VTNVLLDTDTCIYILKAQIPSLETKLGKFKPGKVSVSAITVAELEYGVQKSATPDKNGTAVINFLASVEILPFGNAEAEIYGRLRARLEKKGTPIGGLDMLIASQAIASNLTLVTNNTREFIRVEDLHLANWMK